jgi:hypothetical protein
MAREELQAASEELRAAAVAADEGVRERIYEQSNQLASLATRDADPDHGRLDRHMHALAELADETDDEVHEHVVAARESIREFREDLPGV